MSEQHAFKKEKNTSRWDSDHSQIMGSTAFTFWRHLLASEVLFSASNSCAAWLYSSAAWPLSPAFSVSSASACWCRVDS